MSPRVRTGLVLLAVFLGVLLLGGQSLFAVLVALMAGLGAREYQRLASPGAGPRELAFVSAWAGAVALGFLSPSASVPLAVLFFGALLYLGAWVLGPGPTPETLPRWGAALGAAVFVGLFLGQAIWVRRHGIGPVFFVAAVVSVGDIAAYYVGSRFGRRRLAPAVSPKKSVEGALASLVAGGLTALVLGVALPLPHSAGASLAIGLLVNGAGQLGDLAESLVKRCAGAKDSGTVFPGHGGVLDRVDALVFALPVYASFLHWTAG